MIPTLDGGLDLYKDTDNSVYCKDCSDVAKVSYVVIGRSRANGTKGKCAVCSAEYTGLPAIIETKY